MQLDTIRIIQNNQVFWAVTVDGVAEGAPHIVGVSSARPFLYGSTAAAFKRMDELWAKRPQGDKTLEALYVGRD